MKRLFYIICTVGVCTLTLYSCLPQEPDYNNINLVSIDSVKSLSFNPAHFTLVADGKAELPLNTRLFRKVNDEIIPSRIPDDWIEYYNDKGERIDKYLRANSTQPDEIKVYVQLKGYEQITDEKRRDALRSDTLTIKFREPIPDERYQQITYPVVFHIIQTSDEIKNYGDIQTKRLMEYFDKLNQVFNGELSVAPNRGNAKISFRLAAYDPLGRPLIEPGINRYTLETGAIGTDAYAFIKSKNLNWSPEHYLNVWLIRGAEQPDKKLCRPYTVWENYPGNLPGLALTTIPKTTDREASSEPEQTGILADLKGVTSYNSDVQDLLFYFGQYFGLLTNYGGDNPVNNYCPDALTFQVRPNNVQNIGYTKTVRIDGVSYMFTAENIMDDPRSHHKAVTLDQIERIRTVTEWCPDRQAYRSEFAFTGK